MVQLAILNIWKLITRHAGPMLVAGLVAVSGYQHSEIRSLSTRNAKLERDYQNALENPKIIETVKYEPIDKPVPFKVLVPGETHIVTVQVEKIVPTAGPTRIVTVAPPVLCATVDECKRIFGASEQTITAQMHLRVGTVVPVTLDNKPVNLPLASDYPIHMTLVMDTRGVFSGVGEPDNPLQPDTVSTSTQIVQPIAPPRPRRWDISVGAGLASTFQNIARGSVRYSVWGPFFVQGDIVYPVTPGPLPLYGDVWVGAHFIF